MNLPNKITIVRLILSPMIMAMIICDYYFVNPLSKQIHSIDPSRYLVCNINYQLSIFLLIGGILFIIAAFSDFLDGYWARKYHQITNFGKFFDPIADKILINGVLILFAWNGFLPFWITLVLILRDTCVDFLRMLLAKQQVTLAAGLWGKLKTIFQMIGLSILFFASYRLFNERLGLEYSWYNQIILVPMYIATCFSLYSGFDYFWKARSFIFSNLGVN